MTDITDGYPAIDKLLSSRAKGTSALREELLDLFILLADNEHQVKILTKEIEPLSQFYQDTLNRSVRPVPQQLLSGNCLAEGA